MKARQRKSGLGLLRWPPSLGIRGRVRKRVARLRHRLPLGYSLPPKLVHFHLTWRCNLRCDMCPYWGDTGARKEMPPGQLRQELTREEVLQFVDEMATFKPTLLLIGGEPLLHENVPDILAACAERKVPTEIMTNGVLLAKHAEDIVRYRVQQVGISIDGPEDIHDSIRGIPGTFKRLDTGMRLINELKHEAGSSLPRLAMNLTLHNLNLERLEEMVEVVCSLGLKKLRINHQWFTTQQDYEAYSELSRRLLGVECTTWKAYIRELPVMKLGGFQETMKRVRVRAEEAGMEVLEFPQFRPDELEEYYTNPDFRPRTFPKRCEDPWHTAFVMPDGNLWMCSETDYIVGNVLRTPFLKLWNNARARHFRRQLQRYGAFPVCWRCCGLYRSSPLRTLHQSWSDPTRYSTDEEHLVGPHRPDRRMPDSVCSGCSEQTR